VELCIFRCYQSFIRKVLIFTENTHISEAVFSPATTISTNNSWYLYNGLRCWNSTPHSKQIRKELISLYWATFLTALSTTRDQFIVFSPVRELHQWHYIPHYHNAGSKTIRRVYSSLQQTISPLFWCMYCSSGAVCYPDQQMHGIYIYIYILTILYVS